MSDKLEDLLAGRIKLPTGGTKIGPTPEPSKGRWLLEAVTGYPADPLAEMTPLNGIQMLAGGLGAAKGLGKWAKVLKGTGGAVKGEIAKDLYGINPTQTRRQFFDRMRGKPAERARTAYDKAFDSALTNTGRQTGKGDGVDVWGILAEEAQETRNWKDGGASSLKKLMDRNFQRRLPSPDIEKKIDLLNVGAGLRRELEEQVTSAFPATDILHSYLRRFTGK